MDAAQGRGRHRQFAQHAERIQRVQARGGKGEAALVEAWRHRRRHARLQQADAQALSFQRAGQAAADQAAAEDEDVEVVHALS